jgi:hypothetical protein
LLKAAGDKEEEEEKMVVYDKEAALEKLETGFAVKFKGQFLIPQTLLFKELAKRNLMQDMLLSFRDRKQFEVYCFFGIFMIFNIVFSATDVGHS